MWILLGTVFIASLLGSLHCVGMCGPVAMLATSADGNQKRSHASVVAYSVGRLVTYAIVGLFAGSLGMALNIGTAFNHWQQTATLAAGILMVLVGAISLARWFGWQIKLPQIFKPAQQILRLGYQRARQLSPTRKAFTVGALTTLMPCGWLYTFAITSAGTGSPLWGVAVMVAFWAGTVPIMVGFMMGMNRIATPIQKRLPAVMAGLVIAIGFFTIFFRAPVSVANEETPVGNQSELVESIQNIDHNELPCCKD
jgi:sulfite exporter TauE/SafE